MLNGIDFSFGSGLTTAQIKAAGKSFVCRYLSGGNPKDISKAELANYKAAGIPVVFVWETDGIMRSKAEGVSHAHAADTQLGSIGAPGATVFFAADAAAMPDLPGYMSGVVSVIGKSRAGIYGGIGSVGAAFNNGQCSYGWQTAAWSSGKWDNRALIRQVQNDVKVGPATCDLDEAAFWSSSQVLGLSDDFGQWPRPASKPSGGPYRHVVPAGNTTSLWRVAEDRHVGMDSLVTLSLANLNAANAAVMRAYVTLDDACVAAKINHPAMPMGMVYYTRNP